VRWCRCWLLWRPGRCLCFAAGSPLFCGWPLLSSPRIRSAESRSRCREGPGLWFGVLCSLGEYVSIEWAALKARRRRVDVEHSLLRQSPAGRLQHFRALKRPWPTVLVRIFARTLPDQGTLAPARRDHGRKNSSAALWRLPRRDTVAETHNGVRNLDGLR
jgi:hypothetical protein